MLSLPSCRQAGLQQPLQSELDADRNVPFTRDGCCCPVTRQPGLTQLLLTVTASNTHVVRLYEQAGFRAWGLLPCAIVVGGVGYDKLHMRRLLTSPTGLDGHNQQPAP